MNENARKWVDALRSGEFEQGMFGLRSRTGKHCCLGVACEIYRRETGRGEWADRCGGQYVDFMPNPRQWYGFDLPPEVADFFGLGDRAGAFNDGGGGDSLMTRNDGGATFAEIAALIESEPRGLFVS